MDLIAPAGSAKKLTQIKGFLATPGWSPNGKTIALLFTENATRAAGPLVAETPETGEIKDSFFEQRLALVDVATGKLEQISPADTYVYEYDWSPDGLRFAVTAALGNGDNNWYIAELYTLDAATGGEDTNITPDMKGSASWLTWTSGGSIIFGEYIEGDSAVASINPADGTKMQLFRHAGQLTAGAWGINLSLARDGQTSAVIRSSFSEPPEVWAGPI